MTTRLLPSTIFLMPDAYAGTIPDPMADAEMQERIRELRERVDEVDRELIQALSERRASCRRSWISRQRRGPPSTTPNARKRSCVGWSIATQVRSTTPR